MTTDTEYQLLSPYVHKTPAQRARVAARFHTEAAKRFRMLGNEADALRADQFAAYWNKKASA